MIATIRCVRALTNDQTTELTFEPDVINGPNAEWAATLAPELHLTIVVDAKGEAAKELSLGRRFRLTFEPID